MSVFRGEGVRGRVVARVALAAVVVVATVLAARSGDTLVFSVLTVAISSGVGAFLIDRRPRNVVGWLVLAIGLTNLAFTMLALAVIDHFGRRMLMLVGSLGYIVSLAATAWAFYTYGREFTSTGSVIVLVSLMVFIASHAFGQGAVIWVFISEIFPNAVRARGAALGSFTHWIMNALISWTFPLVAKEIGQPGAGIPFAFFAAMMLVQLFVVGWFFPETKQVALEDMDKKIKAN